MNDTTRRYSDPNRFQRIPVDEFEKWRQFQYDMGREERKRKIKTAIAIVFIIGLAVWMMLFLSAHL